MGEAITQVFQNLRANKLRSVLTMFGILWGVISIVVLSATGEGFQRGNVHVLEELGLHVWFWYEKYREEYAAEDVTVALDNVIAPDVHRIDFYSDLNENRTLDPPMEDPLDPTQQIFPDHMWRVDTDEHGFLMFMHNTNFTDLTATPANRPLGPMHLMLTGGDPFLDRSVEVWVTDPGDRDVGYYFLGRIATDERSVQTLKEILYRGEWWAPVRTYRLRTTAAMALRACGSADAQHALHNLGLVNQLLMLAVVGDALIDLVHLRTPHLPISLDGLLECLGPVWLGVIGDGPMLELLR